MNTWVYILWSIISSYIHVYIDIFLLQWLINISILDVCFSLYTQVGWQYTVPFSPSLCKTTRNFEDGKRFPLPPPAASGLLPGGWGHGHLQAWPVLQCGCGLLGVLWTVRESILVVPRSQVGLQAKSQQAWTQSNLPPTCSPKPRSPPSWGLSSLLTWIVTVQHKFSSVSQGRHGCLNEWINSVNKITGAHV